MKDLDKRRRVLTLMEIMNDAIRLSPQAEDVKSSEIMDALLNLIIQYSKVVKVDPVDVFMRAIEMVSPDSAKAAKSDIEDMFEGIKLDYEN
jgi:predicted RND superfamily exporter protein